MCVICGRQGDQLGCGSCVLKVGRQLSEIVEFYALACNELVPGVGGDGRATERGLGVRIDALDFVAGYTVVDVLELWERDIRETYGLAPFGVATEQRDAGRADQPRVTLVEVVRFLRAWLPQLAIDFVPIDDFAREVRQCWVQAQRAAQQQPRSSWRVRCPSSEEDGECGRWLIVSGADVAETVTCKGCGRIWSVDRLLTIVANDADGQVWLDPEAFAARAGISEGTLRSWARAGKVQRSGGRYDWKSIVGGV